jgi:hypothetical protein
MFKRRAKVDTRYSNDLNRLLGLPDKLNVSTVPRRGERIPALLVELEKSNIFRVVICIGDANLTVRVSLRGTIVSGLHPELLEQEAARIVNRHIVTLLQIFEIVDVVLYDLEGNGSYSGDIYLGASTVSINTILIKNGLVKLPIGAWTQAEIDKIKAIEVIDF